MRKIELKDVEQTELRESEQTLVNMLRTKYQHLDLRIGTALRDLLVVPDSAIHAWFSALADEQRAVSSLKTLLERADAGEDVDSEDVDRILSNFNMAGTYGTSAKGVVRIVVSEPRMYTVSTETRFNTLSGITFVPESTVVAEEQPVSGETRLYKGSSNWYFFVPVVCSAVGVAGNISSGTSLSPSSRFLSFVSATAYGDFSGGADVEDLHELKSRIPATLSSRGLLNRTAVEAVLRDRFDTSNNRIIGVSAVGYGNPAQVRDRHNPFGIGVGGRVDVYVRNFTAPYMVTLTKTFEYDQDSASYSCTIGASEAPGMQSVQSVFQPDASGGSSYPYSVEFGGESVADTWHDFDVSKGSTELAGTVWRNCTVTVTDTGDTAPTKEFGVTVVCLPGISDIQDYLDDSSVRNVGSDFVVRCPAICRVTVNVGCRYKYGTAFDVSTAKNAVVDYINSGGFVGRLTRSEVACVLRSAGATSVDLDDDYILTGYVLDADGKTHKLYGDAMDIDDVAAPDSLLTRDTCVFATLPENVNVTAVPE